MDPKKQTNKKTPLKASMGSSRSGGAYSRGGSKPIIKRDYKFESASNFGFGKGEFANKETTKPTDTKPTTTVTKTNPSKSTGAIVGGYKSKFGTSSSISTPRLDSFNSKPSASKPSASVSKTSEPKPETARDIRKEGRAKRKTERKENRTERGNIRKEARDKRIDSRKSTNASVQRVKNKEKAEKQQSRQDKKLKNTQTRIAKKEQNQYDRQIKRNPFLGDQTNSSLATSKKGGSGPSYEAAQQEKALMSDLNKTAFMMKSNTPMKFVQNQQGVQGTPYQDVNQMNYNFDPLSQQRAKQMQMPNQQSPMFKKDFPDLNKDGKITKADILIGRGVKK